MKRCENTKIERIFKLYSIRTKNINVEEEKNLKQKIILFKEYVNTEILYNMRMKEKINDHNDV